MLWFWTVLRDRVFCSKSLIFLSDLIKNVWAPSTVEHHSWMSHGAGESPSCKKIKNLIHDQIIIENIWVFKEKWYEIGSMYCAFSLSRSPLSDVACDEFSDEQAIFCNSFLILGEAFDSCNFSNSLIPRSVVLSEVTYKQLSGQNLHRLIEGHRNPLKLIWILLEVSHFQLLIWYIFPTDNMNNYTVKHFSIRRNYIDTSFFVVISFDFFLNFCNPRIDFLFDHDRHL